MVGFLVRSNQPTRSGLSIFGQLARLTMATRRTLIQVTLLWFNSVGVEIRGLRPEVVAEGDEVLVHYRSRTNVRRRLSTEILAQVDRRTREHL